MQALEEIGTNKIDNETESKIADLIKQEYPEKLKNDLVLAPAKVYDYMIKLIKKQGI